MTYFGGAGSEHFDRSSSQIVVMIVSRERGKQPAARSGLGKNFQSPKKCRSSPSKTSRTAWKISNPLGEKQRLLARMMKMYAGANVEPSQPQAEGPIGIPPPHVTQQTLEKEDDGLEENWEDVDDTETQKSATCSNGATKRTTPDQSEVNLYANWNEILPTLVEDISNYTFATRRQPGHRVTEPILRSICQKVGVQCTMKSTPILCLYLDRESLISVMFCGPGSFFF